MQEKGWRIVEQVPNKLTLKTGNSSKEVVRKELLKLGLTIIGILGIFWFFIGQDFLNGHVSDSFMVLAVVVFFIGFVAPVLLFRNPLSETLIFDRLNNELRQIKQGLFRSKVKQYPLQTMEVSLTEEDEDENKFISYKVVLQYYKDKKLRHLSLGSSPAHYSEREKAIERKNQRDLARCIHKFLKPNNPNSFSDSAKGDDTIPEEKEVNTWAGVKSTFQGVKDIAKTSRNAKKQGQSAIDELKIAIRANSEDADAYKQLGISLLTLKREEEAKLYLKKARELYISQGHPEKADLINYWKEEV